MMRARVVILTGSELRHRFFRKALALSEGIEVAGSFCETTPGSMRDLVEGYDDTREILKAHLRERDRVEADFFGAFDSLAPDLSQPSGMPRGALNTQPDTREKLESLAPDLLVCFGTSIIREPLLSTYAGRFLNVHLGLSPYYRGSGTNFWPLVNGEPEYVGVTFMHIDAGIDTGEVIHQMRPRIYRGDGAHQIGNRLIRDMAFECASLIRAWDEIETMDQMPAPEDARFYRRADYVPNAVHQLRDNFASGMIDHFLDDYESRIARVSIVSQPVLGAS